MLMGLHALLIVATGVLAAEDDIAHALERSVRTIQRAFNEGDVDTLKRLMAADHMTVLSYAQFSNAADQLKDLSEWKFAEYKIEGLRVKAVTREVALVTYQATIQGTYKGRPVPSPVLVTQVWVQRDDRWVQASYQETPVDKE
jgi:ketosteroid isomerase-like protein